MSSFGMLTVEMADAGNEKKDENRGNVGEKRLDMEQLVTAGFYDIT